MKKQMPCLQKNLFSMKNRCLALPLAVPGQAAGRSHRGPPAHGLAVAAGATAASHKNIAVGGQLAAMHAANLLALPGLSSPSQ